MTQPAHQTPSTKVGTWLSVGSPVVAELAAEAGFDWLLFDLEHGCGSEGTLLGQLQATRGAKLERIVRLGAPYPDQIARALDWGADGIMIPHISSAGEAERVVEAMRYPPQGRRGFSRTVRAYGYGLRPPEEEVKPAFYAQIESIEGVEHAAEIAAVPGVDVLFVGPADLRFDLVARKSATTYEESLEAVIKAAQAADKEAGILVRQPGEIANLRAQGFTWLAIDSDLGILRERYRQILQETPH